MEGKLEVCLDPKQTSMSELFWDYSYHLLRVNYSRKKNSIIDVSLGSKQAFVSLSIKFALVCVVLEICPYSFY